MMRKYTFYIIIFILIILSFIIYPKIILKQKNEKVLQDLKVYFTDKEINFVLDNNIDLDNLEAYSNYKHFNVFNYYKYEKVRIERKYSHLESINYYRYPNYYTPYTEAKPAIFLGTSLVLVNKSFYLNSDYIPSDLDSVMNYDIEFTNADIMVKREALEKYEEMYKAARIDNIDFALFSGFRSYKRQEHLYYNVYKDDSISAKPGHSEHQTGYALDISLRDVGLINELENTKTYTWLIENCVKYGFILRFPKDKVEVTTYKFEPWHFRYVGETASLIESNSQTLEEYIFSNLEI